MGNFRFLQERQRFYLPVTADEDAFVGVNAEA
jgi:hypothetical protein